MNQGFGGWGQVSNPAVLTAILAADVALTAAGTYFDGPSVALTAGTWLVMGQAQVGNSTTASGEASIKLWDGGSVVWASSHSNGIAAGEYSGVHVAAIVQLTAPATAKISATLQSTATGTMKAALSVNGVGNNATSIIAVKLGPAG